MEFARRRRKIFALKHLKRGFLGPPQAKNFGIWGSDKNTPHLRIPPLIDPSFELRGVFLSGIALMVPRPGRVSLTLW